MCNLNNPPNIKNLRMSRDGKTEWCAWMALPHTYRLSELLTGMERLHKTDTSQKLKSHSKAARYPMIPHATCKVMGKVKQPLPQAPHNLCQDATENLRRER